MTRRLRSSQALASLLSKLRSATGIDAAQAQEVYDRTLARLQEAQARLVRLVGEGQPTLTVRPSLLLDGALTYEDVRDVMVPGYQVRPMPEVEVDARARALIRDALRSLQSTYRTSEAVRSWLHTSGEAFNGKIPLEVLLEGRSTTIPAFWKH